MRAGSSPSEGCRHGEISGDQDPKGLWVQTDSQNTRNLQGRKGRRAAPRVHGASKEKPSRNRGKKLLELGQEAKTGVIWSP